MRADAKSERWFIVSSCKLVLNLKVVEVRKKSSWQVIIDTYRWTQTFYLSTRRIWLKVTRTQTSMGMLQNYPSHLSGLATSCPPSTRPAPPLSMSASLSKRFNLWRNNKIRWTTDIWDWDVPWPTSACPRKWLEDMHTCKQCYMYMNDNKYVVVVSGCHLDINTSSAIQIFVQTLLEIRFHYRMAILYSNMIYGMCM